MRTLSSSVAGIVTSLVVFLGPVNSGAGAPIISEVMTADDSTLADEDGDYSDWIEIFNPDDQPLDLGGWSLTDDETRPIRWKFPEITISPRRFLVVFASGKDRTSLSAPLHTNFRLSEEGSYLGLYAPGGSSIVSQYAPQYPPQVMGVSYGPAMESHSQVLFPVGATVKMLVPADGGLKTDWTERGFDDSSWTDATTGVGYDAKTTPTYQDLIETDLLAALQGVNTSIYLRMSFHVDDPSTLSGLLLKLKFEDGFVTYLNGKEAGRMNAPTTVAWNSRASSRRSEKDALLFQDVDLSASLDLLVAGENVLAIQGLNESLRGLAFLMVPQIEGLLVDRVLEADRRYFTRRTPWRPNEAGFPGVAEMPLLSQPGGTFLDPIQLELSTDLPGAIIRYTLDQSQPTEISTAYTGPISLVKTTVVRARTFDPTLAPSPTVTQVFTLMDAALKGFSSNLPLIVINTFGKSIPQDPKVGVWLSNFYTYEGRANLQSPSDLDTQAGIKQRGSSSLQFPKASYTVETWDGNGNDQALTILGFPKESDWVLYAPYTDKTLMRDVLSYEWSNWIGRYAPRTKFVEVFLTPSTSKLTMSNYVGVYVFEERVKEGKDRVDIERLYRSQGSEPEISGGYLLKKDRLNPGDAGFQTTRSMSLSLNQVLAYVTPKERDLSPTKHLEITAAQRAWIKGFLDRFETALYGAGFKDPVNGYAKYIDVDSFIDHHILVELTKNIDGYRLSTFMFKDRQGKLNMGPLWDYNLTLGNADYLGGWDPTGWYYTQVSESDYPWWRQLFLDPAFYPQRYTERWFQHRADKFTLERLQASIDEKVALLSEAQVRNYKRWPILGIYVWPNPQPVPKTYAEEISVMKSWVTRRVAWMDSQFMSLPTFSQKGGLVTPGVAITLSAKSGKVFYTVDLTDPRLSDESPAPGAIEFAAPVVIDKNTRIRARARAGNVWSGLAEATYVTSLPPLAITEVMYHPADPPPGGTFLAADFEYIEIENVGTADYDLTGVQLTDSARFNFTNGQVRSVPPGGHVLVVKKLAAFSSRYGSTGISVAGEFLGSLSDVRGTIGFKGSLDEQIVRFTYDSAWYPETNGGGFSLVTVDPLGPAANWGKKEGWRRSSFAGGSPGVTDPELPPSGHQVAGDLNQDGKLNIFDALGVLRTVLLADAPPLPCGNTLADGGNEALLDLNGDSAVDQSDAVFLLVFLFQGGAAPERGLGCVEIADCPNACSP